MKILKFFVLVAMLALKLNAGESMKIEVKFEGVTLKATLNDSDAAKAFYAMLPLNLKLENFGDSEKIFYLPGKLDTVGMSANERVQSGDITYYAPWGNVAIFYKPYGGNGDLYKLGKFDEDIARLVKFNGEIIVQKAE